MSNLNPQGLGLGVVLKTAERCNIACKYCYFFFGGDDSYQNRPAQMSMETTSSVARFLRQGCLDLNITRLSIGFHGGEPMLQNKNQFRETCELFLSEMPEETKVNFTLQTNGMLVDNEWIDLFRTYNVGVGVSLDGPIEYNDLNRIDKKGRGTYARSVEGFLKLQQGLPRVGILCVINPRHNPNVIYDHFVNDLNCKSVDFLLPHVSYDAALSDPAELYGQYLCQLLDRWALDSDVEIRFITEAFNTMMGGYSRTYGIGKNKLIGKQDGGGLPLINISSDGELSPVDELRVTDDKIMYQGLNVDNCSLNNFLETPVFKKLHHAMDEISDACRLCCWKNACGGGTLVSRYSASNGFNNPSLFCEGLKDFYARIAAYLIKNGYDKNNIENNLEIACVT